MNFIEDYLAYATHNEAPYMFHVWGGYVCVSATVSRRVWLPFGDRVIYPNIYVMYVGESGNGKTEALYRPKQILGQLEGLHLSRSVETPEGLCRFMAGDPKANPPVPSPVRGVATWPDGFMHDIHPMTIIANEFINFINKNPEGWTAFLNDIYDEDKYEYRTKNQGEDNLIGPYIVLLGALTTEVSADLQKARIISTGFARRTIFQYGERQWDNPHAIPEDSPEIKAAKEACVVQCRRIQQARGAFFWSEQTQAQWKEWYDNHTKEVPYKPAQIRSWFASKPTQVLKLAMLNSLSESNELAINWSHITLALEYLNQMEGDLHKVFGGVGRNELASVVIKMQEFIERLSIPFLQTKFRCHFFSSLKNTTDMDACLRYLVDSGIAVTKELQVGTTLYGLIAPPTVMQELEQVLSSMRVQPDAVVQYALRLDSGLGLGQLAGQLRVLAKAFLPSPNGSQSADGIASEQPPLAVTG